MKDTITTREFMALLRLNKTEFYDLKATAGDQFPQPVTRSRNGFTWPADVCRAYAWHILERREVDLEQEKAALQSWAAELRQES